MAGQEGFEPPTFGFGDRRSAVGTTGLEQLFANTLRIYEKFGTRILYATSYFCKHLYLKNPHMAGFLFGARPETKPRSISY